jgi:hypothetical protein
MVKAYADLMKNFDYNNESHRKAVALTIVNDLAENIIKDDLINMLGVDVRTFNPGETLQFRTRKGIKVFTSQPGSYVPRSQMAQRVQTLTTERHAAHPSIEIDQLRSGRYGDIMDLRNEALEQLLGTKYAKIWSTLVGSVPSSGGASGGYLTLATSSTGLAKKAALDSGIDYVADKQGSFATAIVGRRNELLWLADYATYAGSGVGLSEVQKQHMYENVSIPMYRGIPILYLNQYTDGWGVNMITEDNVMVVGYDTIKLGQDGPLTFLEGIDVDNTTWHINIFESYGVGIFDSTRNARIYFS